MYNSYHMNRSLSAIALVLLLFLVSPCHAKGNEFLVTKVIDGDTVVLEDGAMVRYIGIEAPHLKKREGGPEFYSREAFTKNKNLVLLKKVRLEFDTEKKDSDGRLLAYVYVKNVFVNGELVRLGCAKAAVKHPNVKYKDLLLSYQKNATAQYSGLWQKEKKGTDPYYLGNKRSYVFHRPSCSLSSRVPEKSRIIFRTRADPIAIGYGPCKKCKP